LARGIEENEALYRRVRELEGRAGSASSNSTSGSSGLSASREKGRSVDSLSDLTNIDHDLDLAQIDKERQVKLLPFTWHGMILAFQREYMNLLC